MYRQAVRGAGDEGGRLSVQYSTVSNTEGYCVTPPVVNVVVALVGGSFVLWVWITSYSRRQ